MEVCVHVFVIIYTEINFHITVTFILVNNCIKGPCSLYTNIVK